MESNEADAFEQSQEVAPAGGLLTPSDDPEAPEADAVEQAEEVPLDDEDER